MRGLVKATLLLAPALASALAVPAPDGSRDDNENVDQTFASFTLDPRQSRSPDDWSVHALSFRLDVRPSIEACGYGNVTLDGQVLPQTKEDGVWVGRGSVTMGGKSIVVASWSFDCIKVDDISDRQFMKFKVDFLDGKPLADVGFTALFRQKEKAEITRISKTLSPLPNGFEHPHQPHGFHRPLHDGEENSHHGRPQAFEHELRELHWMRSQLRELEWMIFEKEQALLEKSINHHDEDLRKCDSLKCVLRTTMAKAKGAVHNAVGRFTGIGESMADFHNHHGAPRPYSSKSGKKHHGKHGNHTHGAPENNSTRPHPPHHFLPICRFPPPPHWPPHHPGKGPHHGPPDHDSHPDWEEHKHHRGPPGSSGPPHRHREDLELHRGPPGPPHFSYDRPEFDGHPSDPLHHETSKDQSGRHSPPQLSPDQRRPKEQDKVPHSGWPHHNDGLPPSDDHEVFSEAEDDWEHTELSEGNRKHHDGPHPPPGPSPYGLPPHDEPPPPPPPPPHGSNDEFHGPPPSDGPPHGPEHDGPGGPLPIPRYHRSRLIMALHIFKWTVVGFLASILLAALHKRTCSSNKRVDRQARRDKRERRRAYRRHVHKTAISRLLARVTGDDGDFDNGEEKYHNDNQQLMHDAEDGMSTTMSEEITQFQNAASVVSDLIAAPQRPPIVISQHEATLRPAHILSDDLCSEELPAYEDNDGSEASSFVADGFRYTPGSSDYTPSHSSNGSVSDILGADTKR